jgi:hypothetical protein
MSAGAWMMVVVMFLIFGALGFLIASMVKSIKNEHSKGRSIWREFSLGLVLLILFVVSWFAHGVAEWQTYTDAQRQHDQPVELGDFVGEFAQSTMENWQSEFLQLFSFVVLAGLYIHKGSGESKDGEERLEASLRRIEEKLGTLPDDAPKKKSESWKLPDTPQKLAD